MQDNANQGQLIPRSVHTRLLKDKVFLGLCVTSATLTVLLLALLLFSIVGAGAGRLSLDFLLGDNSQDPEQASILTGLVGSILLLAICAVVAIPVGVGTAILLEEYKPRNYWLAMGHQFIQTNINNLAGVPSIVYGILGVSLFAMMDLFPIAGTMNDPGFAIGRDWRFEYTDVADKTYYTVGTHQGELPALQVDTSAKFYLDKELTQAAPDVEVISQEKLEPLKQRIESDLSGIEDEIRDGITASREDRRGPAVIDQAVAVAIADAAFDETDLKADTDKLKAIAIEKLVAMNGLTSRELRTARRDLVSALTDAEIRASDVEGKILAGTLAQRREIRSWYYIQLPFGRSILAGGLTLMLVILPIIIVASQESIRSVSQSMRHGCLALGSTKWQAIRSVVLPAAIPGICTGAILAMSRAIGEAAPIILMGVGFITRLPENLMDGFTAMPLQIYQWTSEPDAAFRHTAAAGIIVLLAVLLSFNAIAVYIRQKTQQAG